VDGAPPRQRRSVVAACRGAAAAAFQPEQLTADDRGSVSRCTGGPRQFADEGGQGNLGALALSGDRSVRRSRQDPRHVEAVQLVEPSDVNKRAGSAEADARKLLEIGYGLIELTDMWSSLPADEEGLPVEAASAEWVQARRQLQGHLLWKMRLYQRGHNKRELLGARPRERRGPRRSARSVRGGAASRGGDSGDKPREDPGGDDPPPLAAEAAA
jgi:hypothetical protein